MTFQETKELLRRIRGMKIRAQSIAEEIRECEANIAALSLPSSLGAGDRVGGGEARSVEERLVFRIESKQARLSSLLETIFDFEDRLAEAVEGLTEPERDVIIGYYLGDKSHARLARELCYSERNVYYLKVSAIRKISRKM